MKTSQQIAAAMAAVTIAASASAGTTIQIHPARTAAVPVGWNNCVFATNAPALYKNLKDSTGTATEVSLFVLAPAPNSNWGWSASSTFTGDAAEFEEARKVSSGSITAYSTDPDLDSASTDACIRARVMGLDPDKLYEFRFIGSVSTAVAGADYSTRYSVFGATDGSAVLDANGNTTQIARVSDIAPLPDGSVEFTVAGTESNTDDRRRGFLSAMKIVETDSDIYVDPCGTPGSDSKTWNYNGNTAWVKTISNLKDASGRTTGISVAQAGSGSYNQHAALTFTGDAAPFNAARTGSGNSDRSSSWFSGTATPTITVSGLDPTATYSFAFIGCRTNSNTSANYSTAYTVTGATSGTDTIDCRNNTSAIATVSGISPKADGTAVISIARGSGSTQTYFFLTAYRISPDRVKAVAVRATPGGSVSATVGGAASANSRLLASDESLVATATPDSGYRFVCWTSPNSATTQTANPLTIPGTASATWTAVFEKTAAYTPKTVYIDAYGTPTPGSDSKTWNAFGSAAWTRGAEAGPFLASDGSQAYGAALRSVHVGGQDVNSNATSPFTGDAKDFDAARTGASSESNRSLYFGYSWGSKNAFFAYDLTGLKPGRPYTLRFVGTQMNATSDDRVVRYRCEGANVVQDSINTSKNTTKVATCANVVPDADGTIHIDISPDPANTSSSLFGYLTAFSIEGDFSVEPPTSRYEYLEADGDDYIDLEVQARDGTRMFADMEWVALSGYPVFCGTRMAKADPDTTRISLYGANDGWHNYGYYTYTCDGKDENGLGANKVAPVVGTRYRVTTELDAGSQWMTVDKLDNGEWVRDCRYASTYPGPVTNSIPLYLFTQNQSAGPASACYCSARVYSLKIWQTDANGEYRLVRYLVPAKKSDGTAALWDRVDERWFVNGGSSAFAHGAESIWTDGLVIRFW